MELNTNLASFYNENYSSVKIALLNFTFYIIIIVYYLINYYILLFLLVGRYY